MIRIRSILILLALAPLGVSWLSVDVYRPLLIELGSALGIIGFSTLLIAFVVSGRTRWITKIINIDDSMRVHRALGVTALATAFAHPFFLQARFPVGIDPGIQLARSRSPPILERWHLGSSPLPYCQVLYSSRAGIRHWNTVTRPGAGFMRLEDVHWLDSSSTTHSRQDATVNRKLSPFSGSVDQSSHCYQSSTVD